MPTHTGAPDPTMDDRLPIVFREFRQADIDALYFLHQRCHPPAAQLRYSALLDLILNHDAAAMVAEATEQTGSRLAGGLIVRGEPWHFRMHIAALMVGERYRRRGIGRRLVAWAERMAAGYRFQELLATLGEGQPEGEALLAATGFVRLPPGENPPGAEEPGARPEVTWKKEVHYVTAP